MKKLCALILLGLVIISTGIYQYYYHDSSPNNIVIIDESHELVDVSINESISNRILAVYFDEPVNDTLRMYKNDDIRMYNFDCITDTIVEVITTCNTYTVLTVHLL